MCDQVLPSIRKTGGYVKHDTPAETVTLSRAEHRALLAAQALLLKQNPRWAALVRYIALGLSQREICLLMGWNGHDTARRSIRRLERCGLIPRGQALLAGGCHEPA